MVVSLSRKNSQYDSELDFDFGSVRQEPFNLNSLKKEREPDSPPNVGLESNQQRQQP